MYISKYSLYDKIKMSIFAPDLNGPQNKLGRNINTEKRPHFIFLPISLCSSEIQDLKLKLFVKWTFYFTC